MRSCMHLIVVLMGILLVSQAVAADKVVVIPLNSAHKDDTKLWGEGRPGTSLRTHVGTNGYCTTSSGTKMALSYNIASWQDASDVCPSGKWVCRISDLDSSPTCNIVPVTTIEYRKCDGTDANSIYLTSMYGWLADADSVNSNPGRGYALASGAATPTSGVFSCYERPVWCCWN